MAKGTRKCKVCGTEYEYCRTVRNGDAFRYQDVACCPEHGSIYLARVLESRKAPVIEDFDDTEYEDSEEYDDDFSDEDFDDEEE